MKETGNNFAAVAWSLLSHFKLIIWRFYNISTVFHKRLFYAKKTMTLTVKSVLSLMLLFIIFCL